jgi:molecular chaperone DnaK (HSP70)
MVEMKNEAESLTYNTEKQLKENDAKLSQEIKDRIKADINSVQESISANNVQNLKDNLEKLRNSAMEMGRSIYQGASQNQSAEAPAQEEPKSESTENKDEKKQ